MNNVSEFQLTTFAPRISQGSVTVAINVTTRAITVMDTASVMTDLTN